MISKELKDKVWSILPKEFKEEVRRIYNVSKQYKEDYNIAHKLEELFCDSNLLHDDVNENEVIAVSKMRFESFYKMFENYYAHDAELYDDLYWKFIELLSKFEKEPLKIDAADDCIAMAKNEMGISDDKKINFQIGDYIVYHPFKSDSFYNGQIVDITGDSCKPYILKVDGIEATVQAYPIEVQTIEETYPDKLDKNSNNAINFCQVEGTEITNDKGVETSITALQESDIKNPHTLNLCEILYGHEGEKFYCALDGQIVTLINIWDNGTIEFKRPNGISRCRYSNGGFLDTGECQIFPSKDQRDWNKWVEEKKPKTPKTWEEFVKTTKIAGLRAEINTIWNDTVYAGTCRNIPIEKSALALLKIHQLIEVGYGGNVINDEWIDRDITKYFISFGNDNIIGIEKTILSEEFSHIAFHTKEQAEEFLSYPENIELLKDYFMI